jgi:lipid II:glycine glycyltransferase (peptidoglycan interpeptide bridge formation enzyme)
LPPSRYTCSCGFMSSLQPISKAPISIGHSLRISTEVADPAWDAFLTAAGGGYPQSSLWAQVKAASGYRIRRILIEQAGAIVGGAQVLERPIGSLGPLACVPLGPVLADDNSHFARVVVDQILQLTKKECIRFVAAQAPHGASRIAVALHDAGFTLPFPKLAPMASVLIDLSKDLNLIFSGMSATTRKHIRRSERIGLTVREGSSADLATFDSLSRETAQRRRFPIESAHHVSNVWNAFSSTGNIKIFVSEMAGTALSALIAIAFGKTVTCWRMGWIGRQSSAYPNEAMHWAAMQWAKSHGYCRFDLGGIHLELAKLIVANKPVPADPAFNVDRFKLGFGGSVSVFSGSFGYAPNHLLRWAWPLASTAMRFDSLRRPLISRLAGRT